MIKNISKYINVFKRPKSLKMKAQESYGAFKRKGSAVASKVKTFAKKNKKNIAMGAGGSLLFGAGYALGKKNGKK